MEVVTFMNRWDEWHAFVIGWCEVTCPWPVRYKMPLKYPSPLEYEFHYYLFGRVVGLFTLLGIGVVIYKLIGG